MNIKTLLIAIAITFFSFGSIANAQATPEEFVVQLMRDAQGLANIHPMHREHVLLHLVRQSFDIRRIGRFVLGRYWKKATVEQRDEFLEVFELAAVKAFSPMLNDIPLDTFKVIRVEYNDRLNIAVFSTIKPKKNEVIRIQWRLQPAYSYRAYKIMDIVAEGVSLVVTFRSEYGSVIRRQGGIDGLIAILRSRVEKSEETTEK